MTKFIGHPSPWLALGRPQQVRQIRRVSPPAPGTLAGTSLRHPHRLTPVRQQNRMIDNQPPARQIHPLKTRTTYIRTNSMSVPQTGRRSQSSPLPYNKLTRLEIGPHNAQATPPRQRRRLRILHNHRSRLVAPNSTTKSPWTKTRSESPNSPNPNTRPSN